MLFSFMTGQKKTIISIINEYAYLQINIEKREQRYVHGERLEKLLVKRRKKIRSKKGKILIVRRRIDVQEVQLLY